jgi:hypothetical protein
MSGEIAYVVVAAILTFRVRQASDTIRLDLYGGASQARGGVTFGQRGHAKGHAIAKPVAARAPSADESLYVGI